ncbi:MAG: hypothetical protein FJY62_06590, partial [Betaproteobacteria bacterium]|nr:hypothetical protein [Betaproteobacteria bacterium]
MALLQGSPAADTLIGTLAGDSIAGYGGDDPLEGLAGSDTLDGGSGFDRVSGGSGNDTFIVSDRWDLYYEASGDDRALVQFDFVKPAEGIEFWEIAPGTKPLPYWIDALVAEDAIFAQKWLGTPNTFYYNFASDPPSYLGRTDLNGWQPLNASQRVFVLKALDYVESVVDLRFIETTDINKPNVIVFLNNKQSGSAAYATYPSDEPSGSDIFINATTSNLKPGDWSYAALTLIHELGHALGLKHPFSNNLEPQFSTPPFLPNKEDNNFWTVMSYTTLPGYGTYSYRLQYSPFDIAALQYLYGPSFDGFADDTTHFVSLDAPNFFWDGKGTDTIEASYLVEPIYMSLQDGDWSWVREKSSFISDPGQITINIGSIIESMRTGSGNDTILGNTTDNFVSTNKGDDFVDGLSGKDSLEGGDGDDTLKGGFGDDLLDGGAGLDTALFSHASDSYTLRLSAQNVTVSFSGPMIQIYPPPPTEGTDTLKNIERIKFADKTIRIDSIPHDSYADLPDTLYQFFVVGFGAAPGVHYMEQMAQAYRYWLPEARLALEGGSASAGLPSNPASDPPSAQAISLTVQR